MTLAQWINDTYSQIRSDGAKGALEAGYEFYLGGLRRLRLLQDDGVNIYDRPWDLLIILDTCRVDLLEEVADEYEFLGDISTIDSVGSSSPEWMKNTFHPGYMSSIRQTHHVTGNVHSQEHLEHLPFAELDQAWQDGWNDERGTVDARTVTDRVIDICRRNKTSRVIAHYM